MISKIYKLINLLRLHIANRVGRGRREGRIEMARLFTHQRKYQDAEKILQKVRSYVNGSVHVFKDSTVSTSSLEPGKSAKFFCYTSVKDNLIKSYNYNISYKIFNKLPDKY